MKHAVIVISIILSFSNLAYSHGGDVGSAEILAQPAQIRFTGTMKLNGSSAIAIQAGLSKVSEKSGKATYKGKININYPQKTVKRDISLTVNQKKNALYGEFLTDSRKTIYFGTNYQSIQPGNSISLEAELYTPGEQECWTNPAIDDGRLSETCIYRDDKKINEGTLRINIVE